jgi:hypothetical protein
MLPKSDPAVLTGQAGPYPARHTAQTHWTTPLSRSEPGSINASRNTVHSGIPAVLCLSFPSLSPFLLYFPLIIESSRLAAQ